MSSESLSVTFKASCEEAEQAEQSCEISMELDDVLNGGSSEFELGEQIFFKVYPTDSYLFYSTLGGTFSILSPNKVGTHTEELTFDGETEANLTYLLSGSFSYKWIGSALDAEFPHSKILPSVIAKKGSDTVTLSIAVYGVLEVTYGYSYASLAFSPVKSGRQSILVCRNCEEVGKEACAFYELEVADAVFEDVILVIVDACDSNYKVEGAQVVVDGNLINSVSGEDGRINVGLLAKGVHTIRVTAPGYTPSDADLLENDSIVVG
ncbi:MAG: hypothetical protein EHM49_00125 [Deltaproteobacteria bacterium]|nr:MAG: hypothetical protein EHM49_00125 [Deltaproteobacteria bacterium]